MTRSNCRDSIFGFVLFRHFSRPATTLSRPILVFIALVCLLVPTPLSDRTEFHVGVNCNSARFRCATSILYALPIGAVVMYTVSNEYQNSRWGSDAPDTLHALELASC